MKLEDIGTQRYPIRASSLYGLQACAGFWFWRTIAPMMGLEPTEEVGEAADTGSAVGAGIAKWHETDWNIDRILAHVDAGKLVRGLYPKADLARTARIVTRYTQDPRHPRPIVLRGSCELALCAEVGGIWFSGHTDQIRQDPINGSLTVWDVKCSKYSADILRQEYPWQLACYAVLATRHFKRPVMPGGFISVARYDDKCHADSDPASVPVMAPVEWGLDQAESWLDHAALFIRELREGRLHTRPNKTCAYCPKQAPPACEVDFLAALFPDTQGA